MIVRKLHNPVTKFFSVHRCISLQHCLGEQPGQKAVVEKQAGNDSAAIKAVTGQPKTKKYDSKLRQTRTEDTAKYMYLRYNAVCRILQAAGRYP